MGEILSAVMWGAAATPGPDRRTQRRTTLRAMIATAVSLVGMMLTGCQPVARSEAAPVAEPSAAPPKRQAVELRLENWPRTVRVQGNLLADEISIVGTRVADRVKEVLVDLGSVVHAGDVLVRLDTQDLDFRVQQAEAQLAQVRSKLGLKADEAEESLDRHKVPTVVQAQAVWTEAKWQCARAEELAKGNAIPLEDLQQRQTALLIAETKYRAAVNDVDEQIAMAAAKRAELALARQACIDAVIRAPFDGVVQARHVAPGSYVQVGQAVVTLVRTNPLRFRGGMIARDAPWVRLEQDVQIEIAGEAKPHPGRVTRVSPSFDMSSRALHVEIDLPNPDLRLRVGSFAEADIVIDPTAQALAVPATAVFEFAGVEKVWLVRDGQASEKAVRTGRRSPQRIEVVEGLVPGNVVLVDASKASAGPMTPELPNPQVPSREPDGDLGLGPRGPGLESNSKPAPPISAPEPRTPPSRAPDLPPKP